MVRTAHFNEAERLVAAGRVEARLVKLAEGYDITFDKCVWNLDQGMNHRGPHRLDVHYRGYVLRIYFTDDELAAYWAMEQTSMTDTRLHELIAGLHDILLELLKQQDDASIEANTTSESWLQCPQNRSRWRSR